MDVLCGVAVPHKRCSLGIILLWAVIFTPTHAQPNVPLTWSDNYFPQFHITINPEDLASVLAPGSTAKVPITLDYQGKIYTGTIRQRLGNSSLCADKRQFRLDFPSKQTFPDGYRADRFETDRGNCYTLHEWIAWKIVDQAAQRHPDLKVLRKKYNVAAIYFNGELYHVQTLLEDVNKDLLEPQLGTRQITIYENGCYGRTDPRELNGFCTIFSPAQMKESLQIPSYLYSTAVIQMLGGNDNYPSYPFNYNFVHETATNRIWFMPDDLDSTIDSSVLRANPFSSISIEGDSQRHFTELLNDPAYRAMYRSYLRELVTLLQPEQLKPLVAAKYAQVRDTLLSSPNLPLGTDWYDYVYLTEIPNWIELRYALLNALLEQEGSGNRPPVAVIESLPPAIEAPDTNGVTVQLNGTSSIDPDNDNLTYRWAVNGQEVGQGAILAVKLGMGAQAIVLTVTDGGGGVGAATVTVQVVPPVPVNNPPLAVIVPLPASLEAPDPAGVVVQLNGALSTDPDNDSLTYNWTVNGQEVGQSAIVNMKLGIGYQTITLTVKDGRGGIGTATVAVQVVPPVPVNKPPLAVITPLPPSIGATAPDGVTVPLNGTSSSDPDNDNLTYAWAVDGQAIGQGAVVNAKLGVGFHSITLTVNDGRGGSSTATAYLQVLPLVVPNRAPVAVITPLPASMEAPDPAGLVVPLNGALSSDPDGDSLIYIWQVDGQEVGRGARITVLIGIGSRSITLTVEDGRGGVGRATATLEILAPTLRIKSVSPANLIRNNATILVISGAGFSSGAYVSISGSDVLLDTYYNRSETSISVYTKVHSFATPGPRDVTVTNKDGTRFTLRNAITIQ